MTTMALRRCWRLVLVLTLLGPAAALAAPAERQKLAEQYLRISGLESAYLDQKQLRLLWLQQLETLEATLGEQLPAEQRPMLSQFLLNLVPELQAQADGAAQRMRTEMASVLATTYSDEELRALLGFYSSPLGKKIVAKNEGLMASMSAMLNAYTSVLLKDMQQFVLSRLQAASQPAPAEGAPTGK